MIPAMRQNGLEKLVGLQIGITYSLLTAQLLKMLEPCRLTPKEAVVLWLCVENPGVTQSDIAVCLGVGRATVLQVVRSLTTAARVELRRIGADRRKLGLHVTPAGLAALEQAKEIIAEQERHIRSKLNPDDRELVLSCMHQLR